MIYRIEPVILELERQRTPILIISHNAVTRVLYAYLTGKHPEECVNIPIPLHTVIEIVPHSYGYVERRYDLEAKVEAAYQQKLKSNHTNGNNIVKGIKENGIYNSVDKQVPDISVKSPT
jgi:broad specificity phosphatase PhoE